jgi:ribosomal protein L2
VALSHSYSSPLWSSEHSRQRAWRAQSRAASTSRSQEGDHDQRVSRGTGQVVQINYDPKRCASYATEVKRATEYSDLRPAKTGAFKYMIRRSGLHLAKPAHYACVFLIVLRGDSFRQLTSASAKLTPR